MNERLIALQRLQIILEVMYEMAVKGRPSTKKASRGEQVFIAIDGLAEKTALEESANSFVCHVEITGIK